MDLKTLVKEHFDLVEAKTSEVEFASVKTQDGGLELKYEGELAVGTKLVVADDEGSLLPAPDATYVLEDETSLVVVGGEVIELATPEELEVEEDMTDKEDKTEMADEADDEDLKDESEEEMEDEDEKSEEEMEDEEEEEMEDEEDMEAKLDAFLSKIGEMMEDKVAKLEAKVTEMEAKFDSEPASEPTIVASNKKAEVFSDVEARTESLKAYFSKNR